MKKIAYVRVSTIEQNEARQLEGLKKFNIDKWFTEKASAKDTNRPQLKAMLDYVREGDTVYIHDFSRIARSTKDLLNLIDEFDKSGIQLISLKENIDTQTPTGKLLLTVLSAICQFERDLTVQRTNEGLKAARARGRKGGRPKASKKSVDKAIKLYNSQTHSIKEITVITGVSQATLYRYLNKQEAHDEPNSIKK